MTQSSPPSPDWRDWIKQGAESFRQARYGEAISAFRRARDLNPESPLPHLYLALAYQQQYIPGALPADNSDLARQAETELRRALELDPRSVPAVVMLGKLASDRERWEEAREWFRKALALQPDNADIWCTLGWVATRQWLRQGRPPRQPMVDEAVADFEKSVALDPAQDAAMEYLGILLGERGEQAAAGRWREKAADARSEKLQAAIAGVAGRTPDPDGPDSLLQQWASCLALAPPPPPPPPPPPRGMRSAASGTPGSAAVVSWEPAGAASAAPLRVAPAVQAQKLITKVEPEYAAGEPLEDPLRFVVVIGADGRMVRETLVSGNPWLVPSALEALRQWVYQPTLVNGKPAAVVTEVRVEFKPAK
jgi:tetratricopeptide (TPR) repeat protein